MTGNTRMKAIKMVPSKAQLNGAHGSNCSCIQKVQLCVTNPNISHYPNGLIQLEQQTIFDNAIKT